MKKVMGDYKNSGFFVLRTPFLPLQQLQQLSSTLSAKQNIGELELLDKQLKEDRKKIRGVMKSLLERDDVREAILVASPSLDDQIGLWLEKPDSEAGLKAEVALFRYLARMATRPTPFGLFAGMSVGTVGTHTQLRLASNDGYTRCTRLDNDYLHVLLETIAKTPRHRQKAVFYPNTSLYPAGDKLRYVESTTEFKTRAKSYKLMSVENDEFINVVLKRAKEGATVPGLVDVLVDYDEEITKEEAAEYLELLIDNQLLVSDLEVSLSGKEPLIQAIDDLATSAEPEVLDKIKKVKEELENLDKKGLGNSREDYERIRQTVETLPVDKVEFSRLFQVNLQKKMAQDILGDDVLAQVRFAIEGLYRISHHSMTNALEEFKNKFGQKYEGRTMPLFDVLDEETGIGMEANVLLADASPLLEGVFLDGSAPVENNVKWGRFEVQMLKKLSVAWARGDDEIVLNEEDIKAMEVDEKPPLPSSFSAMFELIHRANDENELNYDVVFQKLAGPPGVRLFGRFCQDSAELTRLTIAHLKEEESIKPDAIFAEVVHLPDGRHGNVICRPAFREYEISYLGRSGVSRDKQITLDDLCVSLHQNRLVLSSKRLSKEIVPRLSNAHNVWFNCLGPYKFLGNLPFQGCLSGLFWGWGSLDGAPHLPRIKIGSVIVSQQIWNVEGKTLSDIGKVKNAERFAKIQELRKELCMPRYVALKDLDSLLTVDLDNIVSIDSMIEIAKNRSHARFVEVLIQKDGQGIAGPEGGFANEVVVPYVRKPISNKQQKVTAVPLEGTVNKDESCRRDFGPGSEWLYYKIYMGESVVDGVLVGPVLEAISELALQGVVDNWFFIRYGDPDWHLRLRVHGEPQALCSVALPALSGVFDALIDQGVISKFCLDSYTRESERYGGVYGMELSESYFGLDSEAVASSVALVLEAQDETMRGQIAFSGVDQLLGDFGYDLAGKCAIMARLHAGYGLEFNIKGERETQMSKKYRSLRRLVEEIVQGKSENEGIRLCEQIFETRSKRSRTIVEEILKRSNQGRLTTPLEHLVCSFVHMFTNRLFRSAGRAQELVIYDHLHRCYKSLHARQARKA